MKCTACQNNECERKYENRHKCTGEEEGIVCTCTCQITAAQKITTSAMSIGAGIAAASGGVALTVMTGGLFAIVTGAALVGAGSSMVMNPIQKQVTGECMTIKDTVQDVALGATIGAITGPIGAGGSAMAKGASGLAKFGIRMTAGAVAGGVSGAASETAKKIRGEEVSAGSFAKSIGIGAVAGTVGGASSHLASNVSKTVSSEVAKAATRVSVQATSAAATDAGLQYYDKGEVDLRQMMMNTAGQITVATTAELSHGMAKRTEAYNNKINNELIKDGVEKSGVKNQEEMTAKIKDSLKAAKNIPPSVLEEQLKKAEIYKIHKQELNNIHNNRELSHTQREELRRAYITQHNLPKENTMRIIKNQIYKNERVGDCNLHKLDGGREGQFAADIKSDTEGRGSQRVILEERNGKYVYAEHTLDHKYDGTKKVTVPDPHDALRPENMVNNLVVNQVDYDVPEVNEDDAPEDVNDSGDKKNN